MSSDWNAFTPYVSLAGMRLFELLERVPYLATAERRA